MRSCPRDTGNSSTWSRSSPPTDVTLTPDAGASRVHRVSGHLLVTVRDARNSLTRTVRVDFSCSVYGRGASRWRYQIVGFGKRYPDPASSVFAGRRPPAVP